MSAIGKALTLKPSSRGELEITALNEIFMQQKELSVFKLPRGVTWLDTGTPDGMLAASNYVKTLQENQGNLIGSPEVAAFNMDLATKTQIIESISDMQANNYYKMVSAEIND